MFSRRLKSVQQEIAFKMKKYMILFFVLSITQGALKAQFKWTETIKNQKGIVRVLDEEITVITLADNDSKRFVSSQLPQTWKQDGLRLTFTGKIGEIPANYRVAGTPLNLICISTTKKEANKFNLIKRKIKFN